MRILQEENENMASISGSNMLQHLGRHTLVFISAFSIYSDVAT